MVGVAGFFSTIGGDGQGVVHIADAFVSRHIVGTIATGLAVAVDTQTTLLHFGLVIGIGIDWREAF